MKSDKYKKSNYQKNLNNLITLNKSMLQKSKRKKLSLTQKIKNNYNQFQKSIKM